MPNLIRIPEAHHQQPMLAVSSKLNQLCLNDYGTVVAEEMGFVLPLIVKGSNLDFMDCTTRWPLKA